MAEIKSPEQLQDQAVGALEQAMRLALALGVTEGQIRTLTCNTAAAVRSETTGR
jgi:hypothetical protein